MKKLIAFILLICICSALAACNRPLTEKNEIISLFRENEALFVEGAESGSFSQIESIRGVQRVYVSENYTDISCGGAGFGSSTHYYGIFYSADDHLCAVDVAGMCSAEQLIAKGDGYEYQDVNSDNRYYVEPLGNHFFYYEAQY